MDALEARPTVDAHTQRRHRDAVSVCPIAPPEQGAHEHLAHHLLALAATTPRGTVDHAEDPALACAQHPSDHQVGRHRTHWHPAHHEAEAVLKARAALTGDAAMPTHEPRLEANAIRSHQLCVQSALTTTEPAQHVDASRRTMGRMPLKAETRRTSHVSTEQPVEMPRVDLHAQSRLVPVTTTALPTRDPTRSTLQALVAVEPHHAEEGGDLTQPCIDPPHMHNHDADVEALPEMLFGPGVGPRPNPTECAIG